jgi:hypothetical protein
MRVDDHDSLDRPARNTGDVNADRRWGTGAGDVTLRGDLSILC